MIAHTWAEAGISSFVADRTELWWNERKPDESTLWESKIYLSEPFFNEIIRHPVPLDMNTLTALKRCSLGLDLYLWLAYRTFTLRAPLRLTWKQVYRQFGLGWKEQKTGLSRGPDSNSFNDNRLQRYHKVCSLSAVSDEQPPQAQRKGQNCPFWPQF